MNRSTKIICEEFKRFAVDSGCVVPHVHNGPVDPHHLVARGWRDGKRNDFTCVGLCREAHGEIEQIGVEKFEARYEVNVWKENAWLLIEFIATQDATMSIITYGKSTIPRTV